MTPERCTEAGSSVGFHERHPDKELYSWAEIAEETFDAATCVHQAEAVNLLAVNVPDYRGGAVERVSFAVNLDNGNLYRSVAVRSFGDADFQPDVVLSAEALADLREAIDQYRVLEWPFRPPGDSTYDHGDFSDPNTFKLAVVFSDDTGNYVDQAAGDDPDIFGFRQFALAFLSEHLG